VRHAAAVCGVVLAGAVPAVAQTEMVNDPLAGATAPPVGADLAGSVRTLEPNVRTLEPRIRALEPAVRDLRVEDREGERTTVTISTDVLFDFDSDDLTSSATRVVSDLAARIAGAGSDVLVVGHTDGIGTRRYNQGLSERRADAVAEVLREQVDGDRTIRTEGRNFSEPVAPETTADGQDDPRGRARNRRVEISFEEAS
jgi:outer membrane protein OmpA-like peptidoglycan-associated protein